MKQNTLRYSLLLLLTAAIWGFAFVAQSVGMDYVQPFTFTAARSLIGGIVLLPFIFIRAQKTGRTSEEKSASWKQALPGGIICGVLLCIASNLQQIGIQYTTVGKSGFITAMYIVLVPVLGILFHKKTGIRVWISVALAEMTEVFAKYHVSIAQIIQKDSQNQDDHLAEVVVITSKVREGDFKTAVQELSNKSSVKRISKTIRVYRK